MFVFFLFLNVYGSLCYLNEFLDLNSNDILRSVKASAAERHFGYGYTKDGTNRIYKSKIHNISDLFINVSFFDKINNDLQKIRILKLREKTEILNFKIINYYPEKSYSFTYNLTNGWNEIEFDNNKTIQRISIEVNETAYNNLEIAEYKIFAIFKVFHSCLEWNHHRIKITNSRTFFYDLVNNYIDNVAKIESGSSCISSSGDCYNAIINGVGYMQSSWIPSPNDIYPFIKITFFKEYLITRIEINQPLKNKLDIINLESENKSFLININSTSNFTIVTSNFTANWLKFIIDRNKYRQFQCINEIKCFSVRPKIKFGNCRITLGRVQSADSHALFTRAFHYKPTTNSECSSSRLFKENDK